jgi:glycosyltransferase involved in cell wall biosynthesis
MTKILVIGMNRTIGGIEKVMYDYIKNMNNISFDFINIHDKIFFQDEFESMGCTVHKVTSYKYNIIRYMIELYAILKKQRYDIIHINIVSAANILSFLATKMSGHKHIVAHAHNSDAQRNIILFTLHYINKNLITALATEYFACSEKAGHFIFGNHIRFRVINNAIEVDKFVFNEMTRGKIRRMLQIDSQCCVIGHIGRFETQKNHGFLIEIFLSIIKKCNNCILLLIGEGSMKQHIKNIADDLSIAHKILFYGVSDAAFELYSAMDCFVLPSLYEGLPLVGIEAQCAGLPVITSNTVTQEMRVSDLVTWLDLKDDPEKWADAILYQLLNRKREDMSEIITKNGYNIITESKKLEKIYIDMCYEK